MVGDTDRHGRTLGLDERVAPVPGRSTTRYLSRAADVEERRSVSPHRSPTQHHPNVRVARDGHVGTVTLDRPEAKNACTGDMWVAIGAAFRELAYSGVRVVVLTGAGGDFCAGADLTPPPADARPADGDEPPTPSAAMVDAMRVLAEVVLAVH